MFNLLLGLFKCSTCSYHPSLQAKIIQDKRKGTARAMARLGIDEVNFDNVKADVQDKKGSSDEAVIILWFMVSYMISD